MKTLILVVIFGFAGYWFAGNYTITEKNKPAQQETQIKTEKSIGTKVDEVLKIIQE